MGKPVFAVVDCDNFFASCEKVFRPDLSGKPVVVLSNNDGCVVARSREAKELGVPMGAPAFKWEDFFNRRDVKKFSGNFSLYGDFSERIVSILTTFTPDVEVYSIDESFLRLDGVTEEFEAYGRDIREQILKWTGISVSIGVAPSKTLAKAAVEYAKKHPETNNVLSVFPGDEKHNEVLEFLPIKDVWGIGRRLTPKLKSYGVNTALDFCELPEGWVRKELHINGMRILRELQGEAYFRLEPERFSWRDNIAATRSFGKDVTELHELEQALASHVIRAARKLRGQKGVTQRITVFADTGKKRSGEFYKGVEQVKLPEATDYTPDLLNAVLAVASGIYQRGERFYRAGVVFRDITPHPQLSLFETSNEEKRANKADLMQRVDTINARWGDKTISFASEGVQRDWTSKKRHQSPAYTRSWRQLPVVKT